MEKYIKIDNENNLFKYIKKLKLPINKVAIELNQKIVTKN